MTEPERWDFELQLLLPDIEPRRLRVGSRPIYLGRAQVCDVVLDDPTISNRHLSVWVAQGRLFAEDLRSRNGTSLRGTSLEGVVSLSVGDELTLGSSVRLRVIGSATSAIAAPRPLVEDLEAGLRYALQADRFVLGGSPDADIVLPDAPRAVLLLHPTGEVRLGSDGQDNELRAGEVFAVGGRRFRLHLPDDARTATQELDPTCYPYRLEATLDGVRGPEAAVTDLRAGRSHRVTADNRATLLFLLARQHLDDATQPPPLRGWCSDDALITGIWGRLEPANPANSLNVLVLRVRKEIEAAGLDPWFLEKRRGHLRARVETAELI
ncbi:MAG: FHA domain-containing protein [Alphaproteobacteria bacterium]|nr:FHA domain-containing protein [Alphaproteobacteria bacterium]